MAITTTYKCNEWLSDADRQMFDNMRLTDPDRYLVAGLGEWGLIGGQYFNQWDSSVHVCEPFEIPNTWMKFRCMDWGSFHPYACYWCAVDFDGNIWVYRELYGWGGRANQGTKETAKEVAEKIADLESPRENVAYGVLDNACWAATGVTGPTIAEEINTVLCENKLVTFQKSSKGRIEAANAIKQRLIGREDKNGKRIVGLKVFNTCVHLIRTLPTLTHDKHKPETYDTSGEDHACLVGSTLITMADGSRKQIRDVSAGDMVLTRSGARKVISAKKTRENADVCIVRFTNGAFIMGTFNHPVWVVGRGFIPLADLHIGDAVLSDYEVTICQENKPKQQKALYLTVSSFVDTHCQTSIQTETTTEQMADSQSRESDTYTTRYGNSTTEQYQQGIMYTTKTKIHQTMLSRIWNLFLQVNTWLSIAKRSLKLIGKNVWHTLKQSEQKQVNGIARKKEEHGIGSTLVSSGIEQSKQIKADVYNIAVDGEHEFFANGILTHNCDALAYGLLSRPYSPHIVPKSSGKKDHYNYKKKWKTSIWTV